jgi:hypothetical protein
LVSDLCRETLAGIRHLAPEIQILYKPSKEPKGKEEQDFNVVLPFLNEKEKS